MKTCFLQKNYKSLAKATYRALALLILRVPPVLTVALLNLCHSKQRTSTSLKVVSSSKSTSSLGFPGGSLGRHGTCWRWVMLFVGLLGHYLDLVLRTFNLLPLVVMLGLWPLCETCYIFSAKSWTIYAWVVELRDVPVVPSLDLLIMH